MNRDYAKKQFVPFELAKELKEMGFDKRGSWNPIHGYVSDIYLMRLDNTIEKVYENVLKHIKRFKKD